MMHPYSNLPDKNFWKKSVSDTQWANFPFNSKIKFQLKPDYRLATAGSCFAQHISRYMKKIGLIPYIAEPAHELMQHFGGDVESYQAFSARYGNIYTSRQCLELFQQAFGLRPPIEDFVEENGRWFDLLRPNVEKKGFASLQEAKADRLYHLSRVRVMFETTDVFVLTLGLTECWVNAQSGHTYPACPGTVRGQYLPDTHLFKNLTCQEVIQDLETLIAGLHIVNPELKLIFTVSPVPLVATKTDDNVLVASSYSKAVLRAAAGEVESRHQHVAYFPSFEIISHTASFGQYLASDLREVTERGVSHVMRCFLSSFYGKLSDPSVIPDNQPTSSAIPTIQGGKREILPPPECEELFNMR